MGEIEPGHGHGSNGKRTGRRHQEGDQRSPPITLTVSHNNNARNYIEPIWMSTMIMIHRIAMASRGQRLVALFVCGFLVAFQIGVGTGGNRLYAPIFSTDQHSQQGKFDNNDGKERNDRASTSLYPYGNFSCPLESASFSQYYMSAKAVASGGLATSDDPLVHGLSRAEVARQFSVDMKTLESVQQALESNSFKGRKIFLVGDSHTRQMFISLGCLIHAAGYLGDTDLHWTHNRKMRGPGSGFIDIVTETETAVHSQLAGGTIYLKGGGVIKYDWTPLQAGFNDWLRRCKRGKAMINMTSNDIMVLAAGTHMEKRGMLLKNYDKMFKCVESQKAKGRLTKWPNIGYLITPHTHFMTETGDYHKSKQSESCKSYSPNRVLQEEDVRVLAPYRNSSVAFLLGENLDQSNLGMLHPWHGDCAHALQPGVPDVYAADLAAFLAQTVGSLGLPAKKAS